ncbi:MAG: ParB/RepB/Spo0J family partition protein [Candidatus Marinimicrobia bacterium]|nr:ParB/RepB/Spo0J family partition protein [Candidatus Neomarinimicrobiota bacterium]MDG2367378.1 ParB/RepB/Spo0J family partition protein [Candidatus Neomarinimicrobiota bacterium]
MATKRLGKGINALIRPPSKQATSPAGVTNLPISKIKTNPHQPRKKFDKKSLVELASSIKEKGVITPITVKTDGNGYILIAGERRLRASKLIKKREIPGYIIELTNDSEMMEVALIENIQRENLNSIEESEAFAVLQGKFDLSQSKIALAVGKSRSTITNALRLLQLPIQVKKSISDNRISAGHGRAILAMKTESRMLALWKMIIEQNLSVRAAEAQVKDKTKKISKKHKTKIKPKDASLRKLEDELIAIFGTKVQLNHKGKKGGMIIVDYFSDDDLERLLDLIRTIE